MLSADGLSNFRLRLRVARGHRGMYAAAHIEVADHRHLARLTGGDQIVEDPVGHGLVKRAFIAVGPQIELERFEFETDLVRHVGDADGGEVGLAGPGADASKLGTLHIDFKIALRPRIGKGF